MKSKIIRHKFLMLIVLALRVMGVSGRSIEDAKPPREFLLLPGDAKTNICQDVLTGLARKDAFLGLVQMFPENAMWESWRNLSYAKDDFSFMRHLGFRPTHVIRTFGMCIESNAHFSTNKPVYFQLRNPSDWSRLERTKWEGGRCLYAPPVVKMSTKCLLVFFEKLKKHEWNPEDPTTDPTICEMSVTDWSKSVRELWNTSAYGIVSNCTFSVNRCYGLPVPESIMENRNPMKNGIRQVFSKENFLATLYRSARFSENWNPLIELSECEATEIVYLTALCRGWVRTMDEFNAAFVPEGETFLVRLTVPECETEIGRMLYDLARRRGLFRRKGKGEWK